MTNVPSLREFARRTVARQRCAHQQQVGSRKRWVYVAQKSIIHQSTKRTTPVDMRGCIALRFCYRQVIAVCFPS